MATLDRVSLHRVHGEQEEGAEEVRQFWEALFGFGSYSKNWILPNSLTC
jgi:hypothetical protein